MDTELFNDICDTLPKFNPDIARGYAVKDLADAERYVENIFRCAAMDWPEIVEFVGLRSLTPREESVVIRDISNRNSQKEIDIAKTDCFMVEVHLRYDKEHDIRRNICIPFVRDAGQLWLSGSYSTINPILADLVFSVENNGLFTILFRAKFTLSRENYSLMRDGESVPSFVVWGNIYQGNSKPGKGKSNFYSTIGHYIFCKYGVTDTFKKYYNTDVVIEEYNDQLREIYPVEDYVFFTSQGLLPIAYRRKIRPGWKKTNLVLIVPRDKVNDHEGITNLATHFFYVVDQDPERFSLTYIDNPDTWRIVMGSILHKGKENEGKLLNEVDKHLRSLDSYIDEETHKNLMRENIKADNIYDLFIHVIDTIRTRLQFDNSGSMWGKYLLVKRYALSGITESIFNFTWQLEKEKSKLLLVGLKYKFVSHITLKAFMSIQKGHGELNSIQYPGDNMIFKHTSVAIRQVNAVTGKSRSKPFKINDPAYHVHSSIMECGSICNMSKRIPDSRDRLNVTAMTNEQGMFIRNPKNIELLDQLQYELENTIYEDQN